MVSEWLLSGSLGRLVGHSASVLLNVLNRLTGLEITTFYTES